ncbi:MAG TPA: hypothetical protein DCP91_00190 [Eggerthellaceae bacterium]|nr:hypothetical protein [Eggerthellaceae bacterium]
MGDVGDPVGVATADFKIIETITLTLIGSAADGDDAFEPCEVQIPEGTSIEDMDDDVYRTIVEHFREAIRMRTLGSDIL